MHDTLTTFDQIAAPVVSGVILLLFALETVAPLRARVEARVQRVKRNALFGLAGAIIVRGLVITLVVAVAGFAQASGVGLLPALALPPLVLAPLGFLLLDASMYGWHRLNHRVPLLWRFHRVHHVDLDLDVTTALRFHPGELLLSVPFRAVQTLLIAPSPALALGYELAMQIATAFHHSSWRLPARVDGALNAVVVTPRMHQIHHSIVQRETDANWSVVFSFWDRLAGSHRYDLTEAQLVIGLPAFRTPSEVTLGKVLAMPFVAQRASWLFVDGTAPERTADNALTVMHPSGQERA
jgi:sterol desaturase/sphingolipid hydroxylase (fatty acid hydroxylase superfamily)